MKKKILIISASAGSGHVRAARAIEKTAKQYVGDNIETKHIDLVDFVNLPTKKAFFDSYSILVKQMPELWGYIYKKMNTPGNTRLFIRATKLFQNMHSSAFIDAVEAYGPDHIVCTHFTPGNVIRSSSSRVAGIPQSIVITDYDIHELWIGKKEENTTYFVATDKMRWKLLRRGIPKDNIVVSGIPVDPVFFEQKEKNTLAKKHHIDETKKTILMLAGGDGAIRLDKMVSELLKAAEEPMNLIAVAGGNARLLKKLQAIGAPAHTTFIPLGWTDAIDEYMRLADVIISKSGGMTTSECLSLGKPMIVISPIPGQEEKNAAFIVESGLGVVAQNADDVLYYISKGLVSRVQPPAVNPAETILQKILHG